jgi:hypothetical protein
MNKQKKLPNRYPELMSYAINDNEVIKRNYLKFAKYLNQVDFMVGVSDSVHDVFLYFIPTLIIDSSDNFFEKLDETFATLEVHEDYLNNQNNFRQIVGGMKQIRRAFLENEPIEFVANGLDFGAIPREDYKSEMDNLFVGGSGPNKSNNP